MAQLRVPVVGEWWVVVAMAPQQQYLLIRLLTRKISYNNNTFVSLVGKMVSTSVEEPESVHIKLICGVGPKVPR